MMRSACLWTLLTATLAFAQGEGVAQCPSGGESGYSVHAGNAVTFWNQVADNSIAVVGGKSPQQGSIEVAIVQTAVYDAVNAICGYPFTAYAVKPKVHVRR